MSQTSEEKSLPASDRKLREARRKGQVSKSQDLVSGVVVLVSTIFLAFAATNLRSRIETLVDLGARVYDEPFAAVWPRLFEVAVRTLMEATLPLLAAVVAAVVVTNIGAMKGLVVSAEPLAPRFEKLNPVEGFKRIFSMRGVVEFLKGVVKVAALGVAFVVIFRLGLRDLFDAPACGANCLGASFFAMLKPLAVTAVIAFLLVGLVDLLLQNWLFRRDMRMTKTERKRELRDTEGDPLIRQQRSKERRLTQVMSSKIGLINASVVIGAPGLPTVGIRYVRGETPVPMLVCHANPDQSRAMITEAMLKEIPVVRDDKLAEALSRGAAAGRPIPEKSFQTVADLLVTAGLI